MKQNVLLVFRSIVIVLICAALGYFLLTLAYMLPTEKIGANISGGIARYAGEETYPEWIEGCRFTACDDYTDASFILPNVIYPGKDNDKNPLLNAGLTPHVDYMDVSHDIVYALSEDEEAELPESFIFYYTRYWHGYLVFLKPLLSVFSLNAVRTLNFIFQMIMMVTVLALCIKRTGHLKGAIAMGIALLLLNPISCGMNFQLAAVMNVTLIALLALLLMADKPDLEKKAPVFFLLVGIAVVFVDFLTYPVISLVLPLGLYYYLLDEKDDSTAPVSPLFVIKSGFFWGMGYFGMWLCKWIVAAIVATVTGIPENPILEAYEQILYRSGCEGQYYSLAEIITENARVLSIRPIRMAAISLVAVWGIVLLLGIKRERVFFSFRPQALFSYLLIALIPIAWYMVAREHSFDHAVFTFRNMAGGVMGLMLTVSSLFGEKKIERYEDNYRCTDIQRGKIYTALRRQHHRPEL
jgi:hypothetical protein